MKTVYLFRHAESLGNTRPEIIGGQSPELPLTAKGERQARALGRFINGLQFDEVYASTAVRAQETARLALQQAGLERPIMYDPRLLELGQGGWEGLVRAECYTPEVKAEIGLQGKAFRAANVPGYESIDDVAKREHDWLSFAASGDAEVIAAFGHGMAIRCLVGSLEDWSAQRIRATVVPNASMTVLEGEGQNWEVAAFAKPTHGIV